MAGTITTRPFRMASECKVNIYQISFKLIASKQTISNQILFLEPLVMFFSYFQILNTINYLN